MAIFFLLSVGGFVLLLVVESAVGLWSALPRWQGGHDHDFSRDIGAPLATPSTALDAHRVVSIELARSRRRERREAALHRSAAEA